MARVLVTGGAGFVGSHVVDALIETNHSVTVLDNLSTGKVENINPKATFIKADIRNLPELSRHDYVFHLAALARIQPSIDEPLEAHAVNLTGTVNILEYCRKHKAKLIFSASSSAYDGSVLPAKETSHLEATNPYTLQKIASEEYIHLYGSYHNVEYCILRYFNVFGERQILEGAYAAVVGIFLDQKAKGKPLTITGNGEQRRDFTYVKDVAKANLMAMYWQGTYNIGSGENYSVNQLAKRVGGKTKYIKKRPGEVFATLANINKTKTAGWEPTVNIIEWIDNAKH